jgi:hypothetical protein
MSASSCFTAAEPAQVVGGQHVVEIVKITERRSHHANGIKQFRVVEADAG